MSVEVAVDRVLAGARRIVRDDGFGAHFGDGLADMIGVVGCIGDNNIGGRTLEKGGGLWGITFLAGGENETDWAAQSPNSEMNLGAQAATGASDCLILSPPFAPLECW